MFIILNNLMLKKNLKKYFFFNPKEQGRLIMDGERRVRDIFMKFCTLRLILTRNRMEKVSGPKTEPLGVILGVKGPLLFKKAIFMNFDPPI
jgi:hypothetical protein